MRSSKAFHCHCNSQVLLKAGQNLSKTISEDIIAHKVTCIFFISADVTLNSPAVEEYNFQCWSLSPPPACVVSSMLSRHRLGGGGVSGWHSPNPNC